jgi:hypothetical protein
LLWCTGAFAADSSTLDGKVLVGYQGWFTCPADGTQPWTHWFRGAPSPETLTVELYPDLRGFEPEELCEIPGMTIAGKPAYLFSSRNAKVVSRHFEWMRDYGLDGALIQRFVGEISRKQADADVVLRNIMNAARESGRTFAIEYDISGGNPETFAQMLKDDWMYLVDQIQVTRHPNYQRYKGRPVVSIWGMGLNEAGHPPGDPAVAKDLIAWFRTATPEKYRVTYMGGTPSGWATHTADARRDAAWSEVYASMDIVQPWTVGRYATLEAADRWSEMLARDLSLAAKNHQAYMPVIFPGFSWSNLKRNGRPNQIPRLRGELLWRQAYNARIAGAKMLKVAMFDELDEGTAIMKVAQRRRDAPEQGFWLTLDADGGELPSDWYLRVAGEIARMFHGESPPDSKLPLKVPQGR